MEFSFELETNSDIEKIWSFYADVNKWFAWEDDLEKISLDGDFKQGSTGEMKLANLPSLKFNLVSVDPKKQFIDETLLPEVGSLYFGHHLSTVEGRTVIKHTVKFVPLDREVTMKDIELVQQLFSDVPASVVSLIKAASK